MLTLIRGHRGFFAGTVLAGLILRLIFLIYFPQVTDDSRIYADLARNWLQHGIYGQTQGASDPSQPPKPILPTDARLPGYPAFLAAIFWLFGPDNLKAVFLVQILCDLATCFVVADLAMRMVSDRAALVAFFLTALCPFLANYASAELTETLEILFTALAFDCAVAALQRSPNHAAEAPLLDRASCCWWAATGAAIAGCILLRPDGGILLAAVLLYLVLNTVRKPNQYPDPKYRSFPRTLLKICLAGAIVIACAFAPLIPWTLRNFRTMHHFQPLAPRYANESDELVPRGFNRWVKTWIADYVSVEEIYWNVPGDKIPPEKLPARAFDTAAEKEATLAVIADYNETQDVTPEMDAQFAAIAADRVRAHPLRYYVFLPALRVADMWLRPRTEILPPDPRWWEFNDDPKRSAFAVGFGLLNLAYVAAAIAGLIFCDDKLRWAGLLVIFLLLRSAFLATLENPEPRYTLECFPAVMVFAAAFIASTFGRLRIH